MKDRKKLIIAILATLTIIVLVGGATFAYWTWVTNTAQQTNLGFVLEDEDLEGKMYATLEGNGTTTATNLKPATCEAVRSSGHPSGWQPWRWWASLCICYTGSGALVSVYIYKKKVHSY